MTNGRRVWIVALGAVVAYAAGCVVDPYTDLSAVVTFGVAMVSFLLVGATLMSRVPGNRIGLLFLAAGLVLAISSVTAAYGDLGTSVDPAWPAAAFALVVTNVTFIVPIAIALIGIPLVFPDGHLPSPRFRWVAWLAVAAMVGTFFVGLLGSPVLGAASVPNPYYAASLSPILDSVGALVSLSSVIGFGSAAVAVGLRYRRGSAVVRQQTKWLVAVAGVAAVAYPISFVMPVQAIADLFFLLGTVALVALPWAITLAVLRYRLYDIDRIVSRTIAYALVTGILAVVFTGVILALSGVLSTFAQGQTVAVAASTLAVFALFQPLRRRVQRVVDHRFDRTRYDAEQTAISFSERLRHETDMETVTRDLAFTTALTVAPSSLGIWLRGDRS